MKIIGNPSNMQTCKPEVCVERGPCRGVSLKSGGQSSSFHCAWQKAFCTLDVVNYVRVLVFNGSQASQKGGSSLTILKSELASGHLSYTSTLTREKASVIFCFKEI